MNLALGISSEKELEPTHTMYLNFILPLIRSNAAAWTDTYDVFKPTKLAVFSPWKGLEPTHMMYLNTLCCGQETQLEKLKDRLLEYKKVYDKGFE